MWHIDLHLTHWKILVKNAALAFLTFNNSHVTLYTSIKLIQHRVATKKRHLTHSQLATPCILLNFDIVKLPFVYTLFHMYYMYIPSVFLCIITLFFVSIVNFQSILRVFQEHIVVAFITFILYVSEDSIWNHFQPKSSLKEGRM